MTFPGDLLDQAEHLVHLEAGEPKQASLRRAVSASYYALFHFLVAAATARLVPADPPALAAMIARTFEHQTMRATCERLLRRQPDDVLKSLGADQLEPELAQIAEAFVALQNARHAADYNLQEDWTRAEALAVVDRARQAIAAWPRVAWQPNANVFLMLLSRPLSPRRR